MPNDESNPKSECRSPKEARNPNLTSLRAADPAGLPPHRWPTMARRFKSERVVAQNRVGPTFFRISTFGFLSDFDIRSSDFALRSSLLGKLGDFLLRFTAASEQQAHAPLEEAEDAQQHQPMLSGHLDEFTRGHGCASRFRGWRRRFFLQPAQQFLGKID